MFKGRHARFRGCEANVAAVRSAVQRVRCPSFSGGKVGPCHTWSYAVLRASGRRSKVWAREKGDQGSRRRQRFSLIHKRILKNHPEDMGYRKVRIAATARHPYEILIQGTSTDASVLLPCEIFVDYACCQATPITNPL